MNVKERIKYHYEDVLGEALMNTDIIQKDSDGKFSAKSRETFNEEILKLYTPKSKNKIMEWLDKAVHPLLDKKSKEALSLVASYAEKETLKLPNYNNVTEAQINDILKKSIDNAKNLLKQKHKEYVVYNLEVDDIRRGDGALNELINVDAPEVILNKTAKEINKIVRENPQRLINFSEPCTVRYPQGKEIVSRELNSVSDALKVIKENPNKDGHISKSTVEPSKINRDRTL
ncbi:MAG: hypothetical protein ACOX2N_00695 [Peptococcia bacterium]|jgi:hypothetical protein